VPLPLTHPLLGPVADGRWLTAVRRYAYQERQAGPCRQALESQPSATSRPLNGPWAVELRPRNMTVPFIVPKDR